jgi:NADPH:quinone reductase-like Zn-dependent oxidoreductase
MPSLPDARRLGDAAAGDLTLVEAMALGTAGYTAGRITLLEQNDAAANGKVVNGATGGVARTCVDMLASGLSGHRPDGKDGNMNS